jgi:hypothetical protein
MQLHNQVHALNLAELGKTSELSLAIVEALVLSWRL